MNKRAKRMKKMGVVQVKRSGAVCIDWKKAVRTTEFKREVAGMRSLQNGDTKCD